MPPLNRDTAKAYRKTEPVTIESLGDDVLMREFSAAERIDLLGQFRTAAELPDGKERDRENQRITAKLAQLVLVDENGTRWYGDDEVDNVMDELESHVLDEIGNKAMIFSGLASEDDVADAREAEAKKSGATTNGGSSTT